MPLLRARIVLGASLLALALATLVAGVSSGAGTYTAPDLRQIVPDRIGVSVVHGHERLVFSSTIANLGPGPFIVEGRRRSRRTPNMTANQVLVGPGGARARVHNVGRLRYVRSKDHSHWHLLHLEVYELRDAVTRRFVAPDRKTGFCPGDRYMVQRLPRGWSRRLGRLRNDNECGKGRTRALSILESLSPGWADIYLPNLEGQFIDITGVPAGRYVLVNRVNPLRLIRETDYTNNASSAYIELKRGPDGRPSVETLNYCQGSASCP
jgi:lysyl oxidase